MSSGNRTSFRRWGAAFVLGVLTLLSLSGCVRVRAALAVSPDDLVSGEVVIAAVSTKDGDPGPALTIPQAMADRVETEKYDLDGYVGNKVHFERLSFAEVGTLTKEISPAAQHFTLNFRRSGDLVSLSGSVDLTGVPTERTDVQIKVALPGRITKTNGINEDGTISWTPKANSVTEFTATAEFNANGGSSWTRWVLIVGASAVGVALLVLVLALVAHRRSVRQLQRT